MSSQTDYKRPKQSERAGTPYRGKRARRATSRDRKLGFWLKQAGISLFLACPYMYHAVMRMCRGSFCEVLTLILAPIIIFVVAVLLYNKGDKLIED